MRDRYERNGQLRPGVEREHRRQNAADAEAGHAGDGASDDRRRKDDQIKQSRVVSGSAFRAPLDPMKHPTLHDEVGASVLST